ncbi:MAG: hypothetical protein U9R79_05045 [Armatimonadota bacterium]|nr:hypothetical protein [Armatimonadota bacterium]
MRLSAVIVCICLALLAAAFVGLGQPGEEAPGEPQAVYQECQELQQQIEELDAELKHLAHQEQSLAEARENYQYVLERNAELVAELEDWAEAE